MNQLPARTIDTNLTVGELARAWATVANRTTYLPMSSEEIERLLAGLAHRLVTAATAPRVDVQAVVDVARQLVDHRFTGPHTLGRTLEILGKGLPRLAALQHAKLQHDGRLDAAVLKVLGALADGFSEAIRQQVFDEQVRVNQALIRAKQDAERGLQFSEARFREVFSASAVGIAISTLDGVLVELNKAFADVVGRPMEDLLGERLRDVLQVQDNTGLDEAYRDLTNGELPRFRRRYWYTGSDDEAAWIYLAGSLLHDPDGVATHHITIVEDVTELQLLRQELSEQALHDKLTGLPNEHYFMSHLHDVLERAHPAALVTLCRVNLDSFSVINDGIGRAAGERLLCSVAGRLTNLVRGESAMVARMGTDDFAILIEDSPQTPSPSRFAASVNEELAEPFYVDEQGLAVSAGVGVVRRAAGGISPQELVRAADATLHRVKRSGRGQWGLYDPQADARDRQRYRLTAEMPGAHENGDISLEYQPLYCLHTGQAVALQTLLRWDRDDGTVVGHQDCLALAEKSGLVLSLGRWMLERACTELAQWDGALGTARLRIDLTNWLSQDPDLIAVVRQVLGDSGVSASRLLVGVPLSAVARGRGDVMDNVQILADLGAGVALLCATSGLGCTAYLEDLPVTAVEVAPPTVARIATRPEDDSVVVRSVREAVALVHSVGATVIVPGVDTPTQANWWRDARADIAFGAHFGPAVPPHQVLTLFR